MAATDQTYRSQKALDIVFAVSNIVLLVSIIWMFVQDYNRQWKTEQREFRDVESALTARQAIADLPDPAKFKTAQTALRAAEKDRQEPVEIKIGGVAKKLPREEAIAELDQEIQRLRPAKEKAEARAGDIKSQVESRTSFFNIAVDNAADPKTIDAYKQEVESLKVQLGDAQAQLDTVMGEIKERQRERDALDRPLTVARTELKRMTDDLVRRARTAIKKEWGFGDWFRSLPIIDGFASPTRIQQITLNDLTIDYNFKNVTRFDRCQSCHLGIDRAAFTKLSLSGLREVPPALQSKLEETRKILAQLREDFKGTPDEKNIPRPEQLELKALPEGKLTAGRVHEFAAHPRLDLFAGASSKHPAEKFGCTICHNGQGSATDFFWATHTPNSPAQMHDWKTMHDWGPVPFWDFPMHPQRFTEASCLKCHHQVTDLITTYNRREAPKLLHGYDLIRENGCFGCHEVHGSKDGKPIGPDLRLEPYPAPELLPAADRERLFADKDNPPGTMRKVGPSLFRLSEKTNEDWAKRWIKSPRTFRPDTKMPHFYGLSNNSPDVLPKEQKKFPDAEVASIAHFLFEESRGYLGRVVELRKDKAAGDKKDLLLIEKLNATLANRAELAELNNEQKDELKKKLEDAKVRIAMRDVAPPIHGKPAAAPKDAEALYRGRKLFSERGCLACHNHHGTTEPMKEKGKEVLPAVHGEAHFGPTLSQIKAKLGTKPGDTASARTWLVHWITNPWMHSPRTRMPITHLDEKEAGDVAAWLLSQPATELGPDWDALTVAAPEQKALEELARVYLVRILPRRELDQFFKDGLPEDRVKELPADEKALAQRLRGAKGDDARRQQTMWYLGRKAVGRLGCFGCHDIPGFENAKPIGTALDGWGKKDPGRLAFEDIMNYLKSHHVRVDDWKDPAKVAEGFKDGKEPYEGFFWDRLQHATRDGYLYQKINEPRSYDYKRMLPWDDRSRMPQFKFAHPRKRGKEAPDAYDARKAWQKALGRDPGSAHGPEGDNDFRARAAREESEAREAVMTFVLGLTAESIPLDYLPKLSADRAAEVKGRQVLDRFNCAGCHNVRPGAFDFRVNAGALDLLEFYRKKYEASPGFQSDYDFLEHNIWNGWGASPPTSPDLLTAHGVRPQLRPVTIKGKKVPALSLTLMQALPYRDARGKMQNIRGSYLLSIRPDDLVGVPPAALDSPAAFQQYLGEQGPLGGRFADLLVKYLIDLGELEKESGKATQNPYPDEGGDNGRARASAPPVLINQGERTQTDWLFRFLRDPPRVRKLTVLRMPRFNLSDDDARALVNYFGGVDRLTNPSLGLTNPFVNIPQRGDLHDAFWRERTAEYVKRLEAAKDPANPKQSLYDSTAKGLSAAWEQMAETVKTQVKDAETKRKEADKQVQELKAKEKDAKGDDKAALAKSLDDAQKRLEYWAAEGERLGELARKSTPEALRDEWRSTQAYAHAGFRALARVCSSCHEVGTLKPSPTQLQGPSLSISHERLRPGWLKRWIAHPQRYLPYTSSMPQNFPNSGEPQFQELIAGTPLQQVEGIRDTLMNFPEVHALPVNRSWLRAGGGEKTGDKK